MAPKTETAEAPAAKLCKCGCGATVTRNFTQGHDQRLISNLAENVVNGTPPNGLGVLSQAKAKRPVTERIELVAEELTKRISEGISAKFENAANRKVAQNERVAGRAQAKADKPKTARKPRKPVTNEGANLTPAAPKDPFEGVDPDAESTDDTTVAKRAIGPIDTTVAKRAIGPIDTARVGLGADIRIKVRGRVINAQVAAMNQAGKVTVATYKGAKDVERRIENPVVVPDAE